MIKKLRYLFTLMLLLVASVGWAEDFTYDFKTGGVFHSGDKPTCSWTTDYFTILQEQNTSTSQVANNTTAPRWYKSHNITITPATNITISKIVIKCSNSSYTGQNITASVGEISVDGNNSTWSGSATSESPLVLTMGSQCRPSSIVVTYSSSSTVATPTFTPEAGTYTTSQNVTITCETEGSTIYYTTDGSDPTNVSTQYTVPIAISQTTTLKAIAYVGTEASNVASATYNILSMQTIAEVREQGTGDVMTKGVVTNVSGKTAYIQDANAAIVVYGSSDLNVIVGNEISVQGTLSTYEGLLEITNPVVNILSSGNTVAPEVMSIAQVNENTKQGWLVKIENATVTEISGDNTTIAQGEETIVVYKNTESVSVNNIVNVVGNIGYYKSIQIVNPVVAVVAAGAPNINAEDVTLAYDASTGEITYTIDNAVDGTTLSATSTADWISGITVAGDKVTFTTTTNDGAADRLATITLTYAATTGTATKDVTVTQKHYVAPGDWVLTSIADLKAGDIFVITGTNATGTFAMTNDNGTSAPSAVEVTVSGTTLAGEIADNLKWNISVNASDGYTFYPNGDTEKWLYCTNTNNGVRVGTNDNKSFTVSEEGYLFNSATSRYVGIYNSQDWRCYTNTTGNIANQTFSFYKKVEAEEPVAVTITSAGYATFANKKAVDFSGTDVTVMTAKYDATTGKIDYTVVESKKVPAGEAVVLKGEAGAYSANVIASAAHLENNDLLVDLDNPIPADGTQYCLAKPSGKEIGFYRVATGYNVKAGKAYLVITDANAKDFYGFDDDATGIDGLNVNDNVNANEVFDLQGRRVARPTKGIYIVNGKKVVIKK